MSVQYKDENGQLVKGAGLYKSEVPIGIADIYTEGERQIGVWSDGKPVYQRVFDLGSDASITNTTFTNTAIDASNMERLIDARGFYSTGVTVYQLMANISNNIIRLQADRNDTSINVRYVLLQYTKTTDTATGVLPKSASALYLMGDVEISNPQNGQTMVFDDTDNKWKNGEGGGGGNANIWTGTQAELEEVFDELAEGTQVNITDDEEYAKSIFQWGTPTFTSDAQLKTVGDEMAIDFDGFVCVYISPNTSQNEVYLTIEKKNTNYRYGACWYHSGYYTSVMIPVMNGDILKVLNVLNVSRVDVSTYPFA